jgi:hypothetical protein
MGTSTEEAGRVRSSRRLAARVALIAGIVAIGMFALQPLIASAAQPTVNLGTAASYAVLAGQGVTNTGPTVIKGDLGTSPNPAVTGFPPGQVNGATHAADAAALQAQSDLTTAYNDAAGRTPVSTIATELGGQTLTPGVYNSNSGTFQITGTLTLNAQGNPNGVFIFQTASTLVTATSSNVRLLGGAQPCTVFWQIGSSATLGTDSTFTGTIMALTSIQVQTNVTLEGRVLARNGAVTLDADTITASACAAPSPPGSSSSPPPSSQVSVVPSSGVQTGRGSTAGLQDAVLFLVGGALLVVAAGTFAIRRRSMHQDG